MAIFSCRCRSYSLSSATLVGIFATRSHLHCLESKLFLDPTRLMMAELLQWGIPESLVQRSHVVNDVVEDAPTRRARHRTTRDPSRSKSRLDYPISMIRKVVVPPTSHTKTALHLIASWPSSLPHIPKCHACPYTRGIINQYGDHAGATRCNPVQRTVSSSRN